MKSINIFFWLLSVLFVACGGSDNSEDVITSSEYINVTSQIAIAGDGTQKGQLQISADCAWTVSGAPSWMSLSSNSGSGNATIEISCTPNPSSTDERSAVLTATSASGKVKKPITVTQSIAEELLAISVTELSLDSKGGTKSVTIQSNSFWTISGKEDWLELSKSEGTGNADITITAKKNESESVRTATITVQGHHKSEKISIRQDGHVTTLSVSPSEIQVQSKASTYPIMLEGDAAWTATINADWCSLTKLNGTGSDNLTLNVTDNTSESERQATITFTTNRNTMTCTVKQAGGNVPVVSDITISGIQKYEFTVSASYTSSYEVTECGFCYSLTNNAPTIKDNVVKATAGQGIFTKAITGLQSGKTYYVRAYAKSAIGVGYGDIREITTKGSVPGKDDNVTPLA